MHFTFFVTFQVRVQCFHYLLPKVKDYGRLADCGLDSQEPDPKVLELTRALIACDEALTSILQPLKCKVSKLQFPLIKNWRVTKNLHVIIFCLFSSSMFLRGLDTSCQKY